MNRVLVLLVASMLGTGCVVHDTCDARTVTVTWSSFLLADGTNPVCARATDCATACTVAGVSWVDVFMDDAQVVNPDAGSNGHFPCSSGGVSVTGVLNDGNHRFTVEALDSTSGAIALRDEQIVGDSNCSDVGQDTRPSEGRFELDYSFTPDDACFAAVNDYIWMWVRDDITGDVIKYDGSNDPQRWTCSTGGSTVPVPITLPFPLPSGPYTVQRVGEAFYNPGPTQKAGYCPASGAPFDITGATTSHVSVGLAIGTSCF